MKRSDQIKLNFTRNWRLPGRERLGKLLSPSTQMQRDLSEGIVWLADEDIALYTHADNYIEWTILTTGTYEDEIGKLIRISLRPGDTALDIGANIGLQSIRMSKIVSDSGKVLSFEPLIHLQDKLRNNVTLNRCSNVQLFPIALSNAASEADFSINTRSWNQGTFNIGSKNDGAEKQRVTVCIGDQIPDIRAVEQLALVKIDVEGYEFHVLQGLEETLQKHRPRVIFEYDRDYWKQASSVIEDCFAFFASLNYQLYQISSAGCELLTNAASARGGNLFCIPK